MSDISKSGTIQIIGSLSSLFYPISRGGFSPIDIPNLSIWLDGTDPAGNGIPPPNTTPITTWIDKSTNANNVTQAVGGEKFIFTTAAVNGKSALASTPTKSMATVGNPINWPTGAAVPRSMFVVVFFNSVAGNTIVVSEDNGGNATAFDLDLFSGLSSSFLLDSGGSGQYVTFNNIVSSSVPVMWSYLGNNSPFTSANVKINSFPQAITNHGYTSGNVGATPFRVGFEGSGINLDGYYCEIILYNSLLTSGQETQVLQYLTDKWGIV